MWSEEHSDFYFHNQETKESTWVLPKGAQVVRYGTGPDGGTPYYSPFYTSDFQNKVEAPMMWQKNIDEDDEYLIIREVGNPTVRCYPQNLREFVA